jgi:inner membrane protein
MLIAHLPAGYLTARAGGVDRGALLWATLLGSVFPDFDMIWFLFVDNGAIHHHRYWVHAPGFWLAVAAVTLPFLHGLWRRAALFFLAAIFVHLILDTLAGGIMWLWPLSDHLYALVTVPASHGHWVLSFMAHWTFWLELAVIALAGGLALTRRPAS